MSKRNTRPEKDFDVCPQARVPIAMSVALEVVAELRARDREAAHRVVTELFYSPPHRPQS